MNAQPNSFLARAFIDDTISSSNARFGSATPNMPMTYSLAAPITSLPGKGHDLIPFAFWKAIRSHPCAGCVQISPP